MQPPELGFSAIVQRPAAIGRRDWLAAGAAAAIGAALARGDDATAAETPQRSFGSGARPETGWWTWRGPLGNNVAASAEFKPSSVFAAKPVWESPVAGRGHSSPIVTQDAVFLTTADKDQDTQSVLAFSRDDGKLLWSEIVHRGGLPRENHRKNTEASPTAAFDGKRLLTVFYNSDAIWATAFSPRGERLWRRSVGPYTPQKYKYGYGASPAIYQDRAIIVSDHDGASFLAAISLSDGQPMWRVERHHATSYSSPIVANLSGRDQILLSGGEKVASYDPADGKLLWSAAATIMATAGTLVWDDQYVYASGGYPQAETACIRADGSGEVVWTNNQQCYEQSLLTTGGYLYAVTDQGIAYCWRGSDGEVMWRQRLGGNYSSSPLLVGDTIHVFNEQGQGFAYRATPERYRSLGTGQIGDEVFATPAVVGDTMYLRIARVQDSERQEYLLAFR